MNTSTAAPSPIHGWLHDVAARFDTAALQKLYREQDEFLALEGVLPEELVRQWVSELERLKPLVHRNFLPKHKKGGSVPYNKVREAAPSITGVYHDSSFIDLLRAITGAPMRECPASDPHRCALYAYTEAGDHIGWHYDTSYYKGTRWTVLAGLVDRSSSRLECRLHTRNPQRVPRELALQVHPGMIVLFNGDTVYHRVTPTLEGEERYIVSMQYVSRADMNPVLRFVSNMKDAIAYFGLKQVFAGSKR